MMSLSAYHKKRNFKQTPEPKGKIHQVKGYFFGIQKHAASHLHYDFRLELDGVLKSWAVPKGPCLDPTVKRLAVHVEDHPLEYGTFEGIIPKGEYGAGTVMLWDKGSWASLDPNPLLAYQQGHLRFNLVAEKLKGRWDLIRFKGEKDWFLVKFKDKFAKPLAEYDITIEEPFSVLHCSRALNIPAGIRQSPFPRQVSAQLATLVDKPPKGDEWVHEVKFDGYRILALKKDKEVTLFSRNHKDWTSTFKSIAREIKQLPIKNALFDGEVVLLDEHQRSNFQLLQNALKSSSSPDFLYYIFDLLYLEKYDLRSLGLVERKRVLSSLLASAPARLRYSDHIITHGEKVFTKACEAGLEGIICKHIESPYVGKRTGTWLKVKCMQRQEFVVGGFTPPKGARNYLGSLYLGVMKEEGKLVYAGQVGTGFTDNSLKELHAKLKKLIIKDNPFTSNPPGIKTATWVKPKLIVEVAFTEWTTEGRLRHPSFKGLRMDKKPKEVVKEVIQPIEKIAKKGVGKMPVLTHPEKLIYVEDNLTKQQLYDYYDMVSPYMLPYVRNRPLTLLRCPTDYKQCFYQKHLQHASSVKGKTESLHPVSVKGKDGTVEQYIYIKDKLGLLNLVQMGVLEIHPWGSTISHLEQPDILIFDLDPAPELPWKSVVAAAFQIKQELAQLNLVSFVKTTGGKGLHIVIPCLPQFDWASVKNFTHVFATYLEKKYPKKYISTMSKAKRAGKIFVDYLRNQRDATAIGPYSSRARLHAPVATPLHWDELSNNVKDNYYTILTLPDRLARLKEDPWRGFWEVKQSLEIEKE